MKWEGTKSIFWGYYDEETGKTVKNEIKPGDELPQELIDEIKKNGMPAMIPHDEPNEIDQLVDNFFNKKKDKGLH